MCIHTNKQASNRVKFNKSLSKQQNILFQPEKKEIKEGFSHLGELYSNSWNMYMHADSGGWSHIPHLHRKEKWLSCPGWKMAVNVISFLEFMQNLSWNIWYLSFRTDKTDQMCRQYLPCNNFLSTVKSYMLFIMQTSLS